MTAETELSLVREQLARQLERQKMSMAVSLGSIEEWADKYNNGKITPEIIILANTIIGIAANVVREG